MITSRHFKESEFERCTPSCSLQDMNQGTMDMFDAARDEAGIPLVISCAYRSSAWDKAKKRSGTGAHTTGHAIDIVCHSDANRWKIVNSLIKVGFIRIGIEGGFIHADNSPSHSQNIIWMY